MTSRLETIKQAMVDTIDTALPELKTCRSIGGRFNLDDLLSRSLKPPAVFVSVLKSPIEIRPNNQIDLQAHCAAYVVTEGQEDKRDPEAWVIAEAIAVLLGKEPRWNATKIGLPEKGNIEPVLSAKISKRGLALIAITWQQSIKHLGESLFDNDGTVFTTLYVNGDAVVEPEEA